MQTLFEVTEITLYAGNALAPVSSHKKTTGEQVKRVLVVDDERTITWLLLECLADIPDCEVMIAQNGHQALEMLEAEPFYLLITDYKMPGMDGLSLAAQVRQLFPQITTLLLTTYGSEWLHRRAEAAGIQYILDKPVKLVDIRQLVAALLAGQKTGKP